MRSRKNILAGAAMAAWIGGAGMVWSQQPAAAGAAAAASVPAVKNQLPDAVEKAWEKVVATRTPPPPPAEWNKKQPTDAEREVYKAAVMKAAGEGADLAKEFYTRWPSHEKAGEARQQHRQMLEASIQLGARERMAELQALEDQELAKAPGPDGEFQRAFRAAIRQAQAKQAEGISAMLEDFEKSLRELQKKFPERPEIFGGLFEVTQGVDSEKAAKILGELAKAEKAPPEIRAAATERLKMYDRLGKPVALAFTAIDNRKVDLKSLVGKVVLIDFWATWCGPCIAELPNVKAAYEKLNPKGFEIVGISFDQETSTLSRFVKQNKMPWPQFCDGEADSKYAKEFGVSAIPSMWLIDKKGNLRELNAREKLAERVEKLLAEP